VIPDRLTGTFPIELLSAIPQHFAVPPRPSGDRFASARAIALAFFTGRLREQFYADVRDFGEDLETTRQVASGYICLAASIGFTISVIATITLNPGHVEAHVLAALNAAASFHAFLQIRRRRDPRDVMEWVILFYLVSVAIISFRHSGIIAPIVSSLPAAAGITALYVRGPMQKAALVVGILAVAFSLLSAVGVIGVPSTFSPEARAVMGYMTMLFSTIALGGIAWVANLSRDYAVEKLGRANTAIVESTQRSRMALEAAKVGLWDVPNLEQRQFLVSESFTTITGYTAEELNRAFDALEDFVHPDDIGQLRETAAAGQAGLTRLRVDFRLKTKERGYRWFAVRARYFSNPDGSLRVSGSLQDINFIKAAEDALRAGRDRAREADRAKSDFIATMSHEVRTPLNAILGSVEVLKRGQHDRESSELIGLIDDAGRGLLAIVNDMLDVSRIEAGRLEISPAPTDLAGLVGRAADFWRPQATHKGLGLKVDLSEALDVAVMVDAGRVRQIISNLMSNAIKFTDEGEITARLSIQELRDGRFEILLGIADTGPGVAEAIAQRIFSAFEQGPDKASRGGAGLGLFISRRLARLMGGDLTLEPASKGAHFRLSLIADRAPEADETAAPEQAPVWAGKRALCVDDNDKNRRIAELILSKFGIEVTGCASGAEAIDLCAISPFDLILMDIVMPDMDGIETLRRLRADPSCLNQATPAVALTAKVSLDDVAGYAAAGFDGVAGKPINVRDLAQAIAPFMVARPPGPRS
jgi:PAS domain S-box-containing protein